MTENQIEFEINKLEYRLHFLTAVLNYSRMYQPMFYRGEKICINQERGAIFDMINHLNGEMRLENVRQYVVPESIEEKINEVKTKVINIYNI